MTTLQTQLAEAQAKLRRQLIDGISTVATREHMAALQRQLERIEADAANAVAAEEAERAQAVTEAGRTMAAERIAAIDARLAALQPPPHPLGAQK